MSKGTEHKFNKGDEVVFTHPLIETKESWAYQFAKEADVYKVVGYGGDGSIKVHPNANDFNTLESFFELADSDIVKRAKDIILDETEPIYKLCENGSISKMTIISIDREAEVIQSTVIKDIIGKVKTRRIEKIIESTKTKDAKTRCITLSQSKRTQKLRKGWTIDTTGKTWSPLPMLAKVYEVDKMKFTGEVIIQPKLDGVRCVYSPEKGLLTRTGKKIDLPHILKECREMFGDVYVDGELYIHGEPLQNINKIRQDKDKALEADLKFIAFDLMIGQEDTKVYSKRLADLCDYPVEGTKHLEIISGIMVNTVEEIQAFYGTVLKEGFEGLMIKDPNSKYYWDKRTLGLLKYKPVFDEEFDVVGTTYDNDAGVGKMVKFICQTPEGQDFEVVPSWPKKERVEWFEKNGENAPCMPLTVEFRGKSVDGIPTHAVGKCFRKDW